MKGGKGQKRSWVTVFLIGFLCIYVGTAEATPTYFSGTGNYYDLILATPAGSLGPSWFAARDAAAAATHLNYTGHLATITSAAENSFVFGLASSMTITPPSGVNWAGAWLGGDAPNGWLVGPDTGAFSYTNWHGTEPNTVGYAYMRIDSAGDWYDDSKVGTANGHPYNPNDPVNGYFV